MGLSILEWMAVQNKFLKTDLRDYQIRLTFLRDVMAPVFTEIISNKGLKKVKGEKRGHYWLGGTRRLEKTCNIQLTGLS